MNKIKTIIAVAMLSISATVLAQDLESGYFTHGYLYRHELNPAFGGEKGYFAMPTLGNFNMEVNGSLGVKDLLYNVNGRTVTFLNPGVSSSEFLDNIKEKNMFGMNLKEQILGLGFKAFGGYNTLEVNARAEVQLGVPGTLFEVAKEGLSSKAYDFSAFSANAHAYAEIGLGHSHQINDKLRIGAKVKVLLGLAKIDARFNKAEINLGEDSYTATVDAEVKVNTKDLKFEHDVNENTGNKYVSGVDDAGVGLAGTGFAVDLGAEYEVIDGLKVSAAVLDLGMINYKNTFVASTGGVKTVTTKDYEIDTDDDNAVSSGKKDFRDISDDMSALFELKDQGDQGSSSVKLGTTVRVGAEYALPFYKKLSVGALYTGRMGDNAWTDIRVSANIAPTKWFSAGANVSTGTFGLGCGAIIDLHPTGFGLFVAMDRMLGSVSKQGIPLNSNASISVGVNIPF